MLTDVLRASVLIFFFFNGEEIGDVIKKRKENPCKVVSFFM